MVIVVLGRSFVKPLRAHVGRRKRGWATVAKWFNQILLAAICIFFSYLISNAAPRTGPDRPFSFNWQITVSPAPHFHAAAFAPTTEKVVVVGDNATILKSDNGGKSWRHATLPSGIKSRLSALAFADATTAVSVGESGSILRTIDGGDTWEIVSSGGRSNNLRAVMFSSKSNGVAVGDTGAILHTEDSGKTWSDAKVSVKIAADLRAIAFRTANAGVAAGTGETILRTEDGGQTWEPVVVPPEVIPDLSLSTSPTALSSIAFLNDKVVLVGTKSPEVDSFRRSMRPIGAGHRPILKSDDSGKTWKRVSLPQNISADISSIISTGGRSAVALGDAKRFWTFQGGGGSAGIGDTTFVTDDDGETWQLVSSAGATGSLRDVVLSNQAIGFASSGINFIVRTEDNGLVWTPARLPTGSPRAYAIELAAFGRDRRAIIVDRDGSILWTADGGKNFERSVLPRGLDIEALNALVLTGPTSAAAISAGTRVYFTDDKGKHWQEASLPPDVKFDLNAIGFFDSSKGLIVGQNGTIIGTTDGGRTWKQLQIPAAVKSDLLAVSIIDSTRAIVVGANGTILRSIDAGKNWSHVGADTSDNLRAISFPNTETGVVIGDRGTILQTVDSGLNWNKAKYPERIESLRAVFFSDQANAVAIGQSRQEKSISAPTTLTTANGGKTWESATLPPGIGALRAVAFSSPLNGVAVGDPVTIGNISNGTIIWTDDGGRNWRRSTYVDGPIIPSVTFTSIALSSGSSGVTVGKGIILTTRDAGKSWTRAAAHLQESELNNTNIRDVALDGLTGLSIAVGDRGLRLSSDAPNYSPYPAEAEKSVRQGLAGQLEIDVQTIDDEGDAVRGVSVEYNIVRKNRAADWKPLNRALTKSSTNGHWHVAWSPEDELIGNDAKIEHRVTIDDGGPPSPPRMLNAVVYRSLLDRISDYKATIWTIVSVGALIGLYIIPILLVFWISPARLALGGGGALDAVGTAVEGGGAWTKAITMLLRQLAIPWLRRRPRVRSAWLDAYQQSATRFDKLAKDVRTDFLEHDDVLDAWVATRIVSARSALTQLPLYRARGTYIPFPVRLGTALRGETIDSPNPRAFRELFERDRTIVSIIGGGGSGKTTLACALARWAIAENPSARLMAHLAIPVVVAEEISDLVAAVTAGLSRMVGSEELDADLVHALLRRQRILVIVDALSERTSETYQRISQLYGSDTPINALVVTTRRDPQFGLAENTQIFPQPIDLRLLIPFILEYLKRQELTKKFDPRQQLALAQRILEIVEHGGGLTVTPLLVTLFVDAAVARADTSVRIESLPVDIPEVYLDYLDRLNPTDPMTPNRIKREDMHKAAFVLAQTSLGSDLIPTDFRRSDAEHHLGEGGGALVSRLIENGVVQERFVAGLSVLRFQFDPVAEYLVAIARCRDLGGDMTAWLAHIDCLTATSEYPDVIRGYLNALSVCYTSYRIPLKLADVEFSWSSK